MPIRIYKPTSAGRRNASVNAHSEVTKKSPEKSLLAPLPRKSGRNNQGKVVVRGRGGGVKRMYRKIDFRRADRDGIEARVIGIEYDPNRTCHIALVEYTDGVKRYIPAPLGIKVGEVIVADTKAVEPKVGNCMPMAFIPTGLDVHCVELIPGKGAQMCRSAGSYARLTNKEGEYATLVLPSGEIRRVRLECRATLGQVGNPDQVQRWYGKAGLVRLLGRRPKTRGVAMHHGLHPLGGGSGRSKGNRAPVSRSGVPSKGGSTRNRKQFSEKLIIRRRKSVRYGQLK
ncbi:MAG: 50S ribosomal protein L2 [Planctomycetota bacterium]|nr:50S ribosomal protein L2 [Planctomycetota bacterium]